MLKWSLLSYEPPFATAIDVLIHAATTLENIREGLAQGITTEAVIRRLEAGEKLCILNVREPKKWLPARYLFKIQK